MTIAAICGTLAGIISIPGRRTWLHESLSGFPTQAALLTGQHILTLSFVC